MKDLDEVLDGEPELKAIADATREELKQAVDRLRASLPPMGDVQCGLRDMIVMSLSKACDLSVRAGIAGGLSAVEAAESVTRAVAELLLLQQHMQAAIQKAADQGLTDWGDPGSKD